MSWTVEMLAMHRLGATAGARWKWVEFDSMLKSGLRELESIFAHLGIAVESTEVEAIASGPILRRYSKALEYEYSPRLRMELLASYGKAHAHEISKGVRWFRGVNAVFTELSVLSSYV